MGLLFWGPRLFSFFYDLLLAAYYAFGKDLFFEKTLENCDIFEN